jgi:ribosome-associated toxin RatA of RatAB toxin-antitoxin module
MYTINVKSHINASPAKLLKIWRNPKILLQYATSIKKLEVLKREKNRILTAWEVEIDKIIIKWRQWDMLDAKNGLINFKMQDGEFEKYGGSWWIISDGAGGATLSVTANIDWGIPKLEIYVKKALEGKTRLLFKGFLKSIKKLYNHG